MIGRDTSPTDADDRAERNPGASISRSLREGSSEPGYANDMPPTSRHFLSLRLSLHYLDWGNHDAPLLILLHGGHDHARSWDRVALRLRHDWHVICPDLRGHGDSAWSLDGNYSMPVYLADLAQLVDELGDRRVSIVAHSLGGAIALRYADIYPERVSQLVAIEGLGILEPLHQPARPQQRWRRWIDDRRAADQRRPRRYPTIEAACVRMQNVNAHLSPELAMHLTVHGVRRNDDGSFSWKFDNLTRWFLPMGLEDNDLNQLLRDINCPVWLAQGADGWVNHAELSERYGRVRQVRVSSYRDAGHWVHHDQFDAFMADLIDFLR